MHRHVLSSPDCRFKCSVDCLKILDSVEILFLNLKYRVCTQSWILEKVLKFAENFPDPEKVWKIEVKSWKNSKKSRFFFKLQQVLNKWNVFCVGQMLLNLACHCGKSFVPAFFFFYYFKVSIDHLFDNLESGKWHFGKSLEKSLKFWIKNLYEPSK